MPTIRTYAKSFNGGELSPYMYGRLDFDKYQTGLALCENFTILPQGAVQNRPGLRFIAPAKHANLPARLIPFTFNDSQTAVLEFGENYMRIHKDGGTVLRAGLAIASIVGSTVTTVGPHSLFNGATVLIGGRYAPVIATGINTFRTRNVADTADVALPMPADMLVYPVYELTTPYLAEHVFDIHYVQSADVMTLVHPLYRPRELRRLDLTYTNWQLAVVVFTSTLNPPTIPGLPTTSISQAGTAPGGTRTRKLYVVTALASDTDESTASTPDFLLTNGNATVTGGAAGAPGSLTLSAAGAGTTADEAGQSDDVLVQFSTLPGGLTGLVVATTYALRRTATNVYSVYTYPALTPVTLTGSYTAGGALTLVGAYNDLNVAGNRVSLTWPAVVGAVAYRVYKSEHGGPFGYVGQTVNTNFSDNNITPDVSRSPPVAVADPFGTDFPQAVGYYEQRRYFGGTTLYPQTVWATRIGSERDLSVHTPVQDDDGFNFRIASRQISLIRHFVPLSDFLALTSDVEYRITSSDSGAISPSSIKVKPDNYDGANNVQPVVTGTQVVYAQARGGRVLEIAYSWEQQAFKAADISITAAHLFDGYSIADLTWAKSPTKTVYAVRSDGQLLGCTYMPDQQVRAWFHYRSDSALDGEARFESVCAVAEGIEDAVYVIMRRVVAGEEIRTIERFDSRRQGEQADAFFVDCGSTYDGSPTSTVAGLYWLEGETVSILADGGVAPQQVVTGGAISLPAPASVVHVGLPIRARLQSLPLSIENMAAYGQTNVKALNKVTLRVVQSAGVNTGPSFDKLTQLKQRSTEPYGAPPRYLDGVYDVVVQSTWGADVNFCVEQTDPLPVTVDAIGLEVQVGG